MAQAPTPLPFSKKALHSLWEGDPEMHRAGAGSGGEAEGTAPGGPGEDLLPLRVWNPVSALGADPGCLLSCALVGLALHVPGNSGAPVCGVSRACEGSPACSGSPRLLAGSRGAWAPAGQQA